jgi:GrpB-like predicted nucleotidyltransferase (UPF0157 family)
MADKREYTAHQQKIIKRYYENRDEISLQKLQESVSDLYLAEGKAKDKAWKRFREAAEKLGVTATRLDHIASSNNPSLAAKLVTELFSKPQK